MSRFWGPLMGKLTYGAIQRQIDVDDTLLAQIEVVVCRPGCAAQQRVRTPGGPRRPRQERCAPRRLDRPEQRSLLRVRAAEQGESTCRRAALDRLAEAADAELRHQPADGCQRRRLDRSGLSSESPDRCLAVRRDEGASQDAHSIIDASHEVGTLRVAAPGCSNGLSHQLIDGPMRTRMSCASPTSRNRRRVDGGGTLCMGE